MNDNVTARMTIEDYAEIDDKTIDRLFSFSVKRRKINIKINLLATITKYNLRKNRPVIYLIVVLARIAITMHILRNFRRKSFGEIENRAQTLFY